MRRLAALLLLLFACANPREALPREPHRVVTLAPNVTEMVYALGAGAKLAGTDNFSDFPREAKRLPKVGGIQPNVEKIIALRPDLVLASASASPPGLASSLQSAKIPLVSIHTDRLHDVARGMLQIGAILGVRDREQIVAQLRKDMAAQRRTRAHPMRVLFVVWTNPLYIAGRDTYTDDLIQLTGATNAATVTGWPQYSLESLVANPPDLIVYPNQSVTPAAMRELLDAAQGVHPRTAGVTENVFVRPGPRMVDAARELNAVLDSQ